MNNNSPKSIVKNYFGAEATRLFDLLLSREPQKADAIIFLQGDRLDRAKMVKSLYQNKFAEQIVITGNNDLIGRGKRNEENDIYLSKLKNYLLSHGIPKEDIVVDDQSLNTLEQAINTIKIAKERGWSKLLIITSPYHILRAYLTLVKQANQQDWPGIIIMQQVPLAWGAIPSGRQRTAIEMLVIEMEKLKKYQKDVATIKEGIKYIVNKNL